MNLDDLTIGQAKALAEMFGAQKDAQQCPYAAAGLVGNPVMVRTVTMIYVGQLVSVGEHELTLVDVSWIPDTGRWAQFVGGGSVSECEPYPDDHAVVIGRGAILDVCFWAAALPRQQK